MTVARYCVIVSLVWLLIPEPSRAQVTAPVPQGPLADQGRGSRMVTVNGEIGFLGELYSISGRASRRPGDFARISLRSTITAWNSVSASFSAMLSSEGSSTRQDINQIDFNPKWRWGEAHLGDFTHEFTSLTLSGIRVRGGGVMITPGKWRLSFLTGMTNRSVSTTDDNRSYERLVSGARLGYGRSEGSYFDLYAFTATDRLGSLPTAPVDTTETLDTTTIEIGQNPAAVTPQENVVVSALTNLVLFDRKLRWQSEIGGSALTRDRRSAEADVSDIPNFVTGVFKPRISSSADYAYRSEMELTLARVTATVGYEYIGPGYISLGLTSQADDRRQFSGGVMWRHRSGMVKFDGAIQSDNLIHQKLYTTDRLRLAGTTTYQMSKLWRANLMVLYTGAANDAPSNTMWTDYRSWVIRMGHNVSFARQFGLRSLTFDYTLQTAADENPSRSGAKLESHSATVGGTYAIRENLEILSSVGLISSHLGAAGRTLTQIYSATARLTGIRNKLSVDGTLVATVGEKTTSLRPDLKSSCKIGSGLTASFELESMFARSDNASQDGDFDEYTARFTLTRRF